MTSSDNVESLQTVPLSRTQQEMLLRSDLLGSQIYVIGLETWIDGPLRTDLLDQALRDVTAAEPMLRAFVQRNPEGDAQWRIQNHLDWQLPIVDLQSASRDASDTTKNVQSYLDALRREGIDPYTLPLWRFALLRLGPQRHLWIYYSHHVVGDLFSGQLVWQRVQQRYRQLLEGQTQRIESGPPPGRLAQREQDYLLRSDRVARDQEFWESRFPPQSSFRLSPPTPAGDTLEHLIERRWVVPHDRWCRFTALAASFHVTPTQAMMAVLTAYLGRLLGEDEIILAMPVHNRLGAVDRRTFDLFVNMLPLRLALTPETSFETLAQSVANETRLGLRHRQYPISRLLTQQPDRGGIPGMPFTLSVSMASIDFGGSFGPAQHSMSLFRGQPMLSPVSVYIYPHQDATDIPLDFVVDPRALPTLTDTEFLSERLDILLDAVLADPQQALQSIDLLGTAERARLQQASNGTQATYPEHLCIHELLAAQAARSPEAAAVRFKDQTLSYIDVESRSNAIAHLLRSRGIGRGHRVGLCLRRSADMPVVMLGVMKAGACYVPLDPDYPPDRLGYMAGDAALSVILVSQPDLQSLFENIDIPSLVLENTDLLNEHSSAALPPDANLDAGPQDPAYMIYTSGSTGRPKGVMVPHCAAVNYLVGMAKTPGLGPDDRLLAATSMSFDPSVAELFTPLAVGAQVIIADQDTTRDGFALSRLLTACKATLMNAAPSTWRALLNGDLDVPPGFRALTGGEALPVELAERLTANCGEVWNMYGPTEATIHATCWKVEHPRDGIAIGTPIANTSVWVLDPNGMPCPIGVSGELCIGGAGVASGYFKRPELTAERFIPDPFSDEPGARLYKTGDLGRWRHDGLLEHLGRLDYQVKVRGFRIELGEIEAALLDQPAVTEALVSTWTAAADDVRLVAYVVLANDDLDPTVLREALRTRLPDYMLPQHMVRLDALPRLPNGKVDRGRLPDPDEREESAHPPSASIQPPQTPTEQIVWIIWKDLLRTDSFGIHDDFYALGGHSLLITQVRSRILTKLKLELPLVDLFKHLTIARLSTHIDETLRQGGANAMPLDMPRSSRDVPLPVSVSQRRMWVIQQLDPDSVAYNVAASLRFRGAFDTALFARVTDYLVQRHEGLRTTFELADDEPMQVINPVIQGYFETLDLRELPAEQREAEARKALLDRAAQPFDLAVPPLHRLTLVKLADDDHVLFWLMHHSISDNWAGGILLREALQAYQAFAAGHANAGLPPLAIEYADYAMWQRSAEAVNARRTQMDYWLQRLVGLQPLNLPLDFSRPRSPSFRGAKVSVDLTETLRHQLRDYCAQHSVTPYVALLSAFKLLLSRIVQSADIAVGTPIANRHYAATENLFGTMVNTLVMRTDLQGDPSFAALSQRVQQTAVQAYMHQDAPFDELIERMKEQHLDLPNGLVSVLFNVLNAPLGELAAVPFEYSEFDLERIGAQFDFSIHVDTEFAHRVHLEYATDLFAPTTAASLLDSYMYVLDQALADPSRALSKFDLVSPAQLAVLRERCDTTRRALPAAQVLHEFIATAAQTHAERVACLDTAGNSVRYIDLQARSNAIAHLLRSRGIGRGHRVGLCLRRSADMPVVMLGVMKAGACYVPLDPDFPLERLAYMAGDAALSVILVSQPDLQALFESIDITTVVLEDSKLLNGVSSAALPPDADLDAGPQDPAYMIYTSGSTGRPKGVVVPHRAAVNFLASMAKTPGLGPDDRLLTVTTLSFDIALLELLLPLSVGAQVIVADSETARDPFALRQLLESSAVTMMQGTPSTWRLLLDAGWNGNPGLRALTGGEALPVELAKRLMANCGEVWNMYGPTETTVWSTCWKVEHPRDGIAIGTPIANTSVWVLDPNGMPCPIGVSGELCIGGAGVASGYFKRPELTAERFIPDPFSDEPGARLYKTGDLGRWRHDGLLEHLGRLDYQVKVRGFRIELGEIEAALLDQPAVTEALVSTWTAAADDVRLVAYVVLANDDLDPTVLREALRTRLPDYMLPQHMVRLDALPRLPNGKVDRSRLPAPDQSERLQTRAPQQHDQQALTPQEQAVAAIWADLLGVENIARSDNFFDLGGHSMLAMRAIVTIERKLGQRIQPRRMILETLGQLARFDSSGRDGTASQPDEPVKNEAPGRIRSLIRNLKTLK